MQAGREAPDVVGAGGGAPQHHDTPIVTVGVPAHQIAHIDQALHGRRDRRRRHVQAVGQGTDRVALAGLGVDDENDRQLPGRQLRQLVVGNRTDDGGLDAGQHRIGGVGSDGGHGGNSRWLNVVTT